MRASPIWVLALVPGMWDLPVRVAVPPPCAIAIEVHVRAPLVLGAVELHLLTGEVDRLWRPYGITFCWSGAAEPCEGLEVRVRVEIGEDVMPPARPAAARHVLGWIPFVDGQPGTEIHLSARAARRVVSRARVGFRPLADWPPALGQRYVPRVLGRGLAHEIGHFVLRSRTHTRTGLMAAGLTPDRLTLDGSDRFGLGNAEARWIRSWCTGAPRSAGRAASGTLEGGTTRFVLR